MKSIVIENQKFEYDFGCGLLKLKYSECPFPELADIWDDIQPFTFKQIALLPNLEQRRVGINCLGLERLVKEIKPELIDKQTIKKETSWVNDKGELESVKFNDTYELYKVSGEIFSEGLDKWRKMDDCYYVKCKDTSTDRDYMLWVDLQSVYRTNSEDTWNYAPEKVDSIQAIAWTIQTNIVKGGIEKIVRQGDCILIKPRQNGSRLVAKTGEVRHLTKEEYLTLLVAES
jgi:hypothetical protein